MNTQTKIKELLALGVERKMLAEAAGTTQASLSRILCGKTRNPGEHIVLAVDKVYRQRIADTSCVGGDK